MLKAEILQSILETINAMTGKVPDVDALMTTIDELWSFSGVRPDERITLERFKCVGGLHETLCAHLPRISAPRSAPGSTSAGSGTIRVKCGSCRTVMQAIPPAASTSVFYVTCVTCRTSNRISLYSTSPTRTVNYYDTGPNIQYVVYRPISRYRYTDYGYYDYYV